MSRTYRDTGSGSKWEKHERNYSSRKIRLSEREFCTRAKIDDDAPLTYDIAQREPIWGGGWYGYWRPMRRWLNSHIGEHWNQVYSELVTKLKIFSIHGDEIIHQYIYGMVEITSRPTLHNYYAWSFYVDDNGILRRKQNRASKVKTPKYNVKNLTNWLGGRVVGKVGDKLFWFTQVTKPKKRQWGTYSDKWACRWSGRSYYSYNGLEYLYLNKEEIMDKDGNYVGVRESWKKSFGMILRQDRKLTSDELAYWNKIPKFYQDKILQWSPTYSGLNPGTYHEY